MVSSYNRGAVDVALSGGANVIVSNDCIKRAPYFVLENTFQAKEFVRWLGEHFDSIRQSAESITAHGKLVSYNTYIQGRIVYVRFSFTTGDAMGLSDSLGYGRT